MPGQIALLVLLTTPGVASSAAMRDGRARGPGSLPAYLAGGAIIDSAIGGNQHAILFAVILFPACGLLSILTAIWATNG